MQNLTDNIYIVVLMAMGGTFLMVVGFLLLHVYNRNRILYQQQLLQQTEIAHQKKLMLTIFESQEEERQRIGRDLHDSVGAALSSLRLIISQGDVAGVPDSRQSCKEVIDRIITDVRNISHNISPAILNLYGAGEAIEELADIVNQSKQMTVSIDNQAGEQLCKLPHAVALSLYRVLEELLNNTIRHAAATNAQITIIGTAQNILVTYADNGKGMAPGTRQGMGLNNIANRLAVAGGAFQIRQDAHSGFCMDIQLPQ